MTLAVICHVSELLMFSHFECEFTHRSQFFSYLSSSVQYSIYTNTNVHTATQTQVHTATHAYSCIDIPTWKKRGIKFRDSLCFL